jgi:hypothetical protein
VAKPPFLKTANYPIDKVSVSAISLPISGHPKCLDLIFKYLYCLMISSIGNLRLLKHASVEEVEVANRGYFNG